LSIDSTVNIVNFIGLKEIQWILVDEAQFLTKKQVEELVEMVDVFNVEVMCFGLRTDFQSNFFEGSKRLMELSDEIEEIKSRCDCGRKTSINARFDENNNLLIDGEQIVIGGNDKYKALCRKCWFEMKNQIENKQK
jgi:thymidine kinase